MVHLSAMRTGVFFFKEVYWHFLSACNKDM
jgi:hypothetical protein